MSKLSLRQSEINLLCAHYCILVVILFYFLYFFIYFIFLRFFFSLFFCFCGREGSGEEGIGAKKKLGDTECEISSCSLQLETELCQWISLWYGTAQNPFFIVYLAPHNPTVVYCQKTYCSFRSDTLMVFFVFPQRVYQKLNINGKKKKERLCYIHVCHLPLSPT